MNRFENVTKPLMWFMALLLTALVAGCGGGSQDPILGGGGIGGGVVPPPAVVPVAPGAGNCAAAVGNPLIPQILSSNPTDGNLNATPKTTGVAGKRITATFSLAMDLLTINDASTLSTSTFSLRETLSGNNVAGIVTMNATNPINTIATLETAAPLPAMSYTATITTAATAADTTPLACVYEWSFTVVTPPVEGLGFDRRSVAADLRPEERQSRRPRVQRQARVRSRRRHGRRRRLEGARRPCDHLGLRGRHGRFAAHLDQACRHPPGKSALPKRIRRWC